ncbi:hypothetical protein [Nocardioides sp. TF02-7]|uniref:hypothetical protein n=1 Tax=Nocardioides sp. TF02-7 TaxID=2917724 RepID=UPI001F05C51E|nr:hypothetical protein [Nocardioides sp. TF02-7]UMG92104.1 hypothetical protein MF408_19445 [Nocardioides sp. TF02-7]
MTDVDALGRGQSWRGVRAVVAGFGASGAAAVDNLLHLDADVTAVADAVGEGLQPRAELLEALGARFRVGSDATATLPDDTDLLVVSPGFPPGAPLLEQASGRGVPVWGRGRARVAAPRPRAAGPVAVRGRRGPRDRRHRPRPDPAGRRPAQRRGGRPPAPRSPRP